MGLSASQGRLLLLTARQTDLEYQAQQISQQRLALANKLDQISSDYEEATSNRQMIITLQTSDGSSVISNLTYANLVSGAAALGSDVSGLNQVSGVNTSSYSNSQAFRLTDGNGTIVVSDVSEIPAYSDGTEVTEDDLVNNKVTVDGVSYLVDTELASSSSGINYLQNCLRNGKYIIEEYSASSDESWQEVAWDSASVITDQYYEDDDAAAEAKYDRLSRQVETQDKKLQLDLDNIETQRDAVSTETESVEQVISDNIEKSFDAFG